VEILAVIAFAIMAIGMIILNNKMDSVAKIN